MATGEVRIDSETLKAFTRDLFIRVGLEAPDAEVQAEVLVWANLRGVDSHGVLRVPYYVEFADTGEMKTRPKIQILKETPATLLIDADHAFGPVVTIQAMNQVIEKARAVGIGWALLRNVTHQGAIGYYSLMAAKAGMAGITIVCSPANMAPYGAKAAGVHNSPIAICVPGRQHPPLLLDMATSVAAGGKLKFAKDRGVPLPLGWALDKEGTPTTDPTRAAILLPFGGPKGSGLALMFECLTSLMAGNPLLEPCHKKLPGADAHRQNSVVAAINIGMFTELDAYQARVDSAIEGIKALPLAEGSQEILVPGELEDRVYEERRKHGIPLPAGTVKNLMKVADRFGVPIPEALARGR